MILGSRAVSRPHVWPLLARGGWKTPGELGCGFGLTGSGHARHEMKGLLESGRAIVTVVPGNGRTMYHRETSETRRLYPEEASLSFQQLPCPLKRSLIRKMIRMPHDSKPEPAIAVWARAMMRFEEHLDTIGLNAIKPRPEKNFFFPCGWLAAYDQSLNPAIPPPREYTFRVDFAEVIPRRFANLPCGDESWFENDEHQCSIVLGMDASLHLKMSSVTEVKMARKSFEVVDCPSRDAIVDETVKRLQAAAAEWNMMIPFTPITINPDFQLLTDNAHEK